MFTWVPIYNELANKLLQYRDRQKDLIAILQAAKNQGLPMISFVDRGTGDREVPLSEIDPFTFFAAFNRTSTVENRIRILQVIKEKMGLQSEVPQDLNGIPIVFAMRSWFFPWEVNRNGSEIPALWDLAESVVKNKPTAIAPECFNECLGIEGVTITNLTMGLYWLRPETYLALDSQNVTHLKSRGLPSEATDWTTYLDFLSTVRLRITETPYEFSYAAYMDGRKTGGGKPPVSPPHIETPRYWLYAPGPNAMYWDECKEKGIMVYGADQLPDLMTYSDKESIEKDLNKAKRNKKRATNDARAAWEFSRVIKLGDIVIVKHGRRKFLGYGIVSGEYRHDASRKTYRNVIPVEWKKVGAWDKEGGGPIVLKTLTDITKYPDYVADLKNLLGIDNIPPGTELASMPRNLILYGPPGTGKTWTLRNDYMKRFTESAATMTAETFTTELVSDLAWWEVITMVMLELKSGKVSALMAHPLMKTRIQRANNRTPRAAIWAHLQMHTKTECAEVKYTKRYEPMLFSKDARSVWTIDSKLAHEEVPELVEKLNRYRTFKPGQGPEVKRYAFTTFHQSYSYEDFVEGIKPDLGEDVTETLAYEIKPGVFKTMVQRAIADPDHDYAIIIDEINRGNVANIFGELITLIEDDKRKDMPNELRATLPYSRLEFVVPRNLFIIGAMNTADRSVEALDTALRRRFTFVAVPPHPEWIKQPAGLAVDLQHLLRVINARIEKLLDKDHCIGHSYFMGIADRTDPLNELRTVFATKIVPLLEEYFYGDPAKIGMVLGDRFVTRNGESVSWGKGDWGLDEFEERHVYTICDPMELTESDFQSVYAHE